MHMDLQRGAREPCCTVRQGEPNLFSLQLERAQRQESARHRKADCGDDGGGAHEDRYHHRRGCGGCAFVRGMDVHRQTGRGQAGRADGVPDERRGNR